MFPRRMNPPCCKPRQLRREETGLPPHPLCQLRRLVQGLAKSCSPESSASQRQQQKHKLLGMLGIYQLWGGVSSSLWGSPRGSKHSLWVTPQALHPSKMEEKPQRRLEGTQSHTGAKTGAKTEPGQGEGGPAISPPPAPTKGELRKGAPTTPVLSFSGKGLTYNDNERCLSFFMRK